jgi:hypothetical protein
VSFLLFELDQLLKNALPSFIVKVEAQRFQSSHIIEFQPDVVFVLLSLVALGTLMIHPHAQFVQIRLCFHLLICVGAGSSRNMNMPTL